MLLAALSAKIREYVKSDLGPLQKRKHVQDLLVSHNVAYHTLAKADAFVVHEKNRSGTLINPYSMHSKGLQIIQTGADVSLLQSVCFELSPDATQKEKQVKKFKELCANSEYMPKVSGAERFASLSSGHTSQFIKAIMTCTPTPEDDLADSGGLLGGHLYNNSSDSDLKNMIQQGWTWLVLPHYVEESHPELADLIQKALNASNSIYATQSEMELASSIMNAVLDHGGKVDDWDELSFDLCEGPQFKKNDIYKTIAKFVRMFSGPGFFVIDFTYRYHVYIYTCVISCFSFLRASIQAAQ